MNHEDVSLSHVFQNIASSHHSQHEDIIERCITRIMIKIIPPKEQTRKLSLLDVLKNITVVSPSILFTNIAALHRIRYREWSINIYHLLYVVYTIDMGFSPSIYPRYYTGEHKEYMSARISSIPMKLLSSKSILGDLYRRYNIPYRVYNNENYHIHLNDIVGIIVPPTYDCQPIRNKNILDDLNKTLHMELAKPSINLWKLLKQIYTNTKEIRLVVLIRDVCFVYFLQHSEYYRTHKNLPRYYDLLLPDPFILYHVTKCVVGGNYYMLNEIYKFNKDDGTYQWNWNKSATNELFKRTDRDDCFAINFIIRTHMLVNVFKLLCDSGIISKYDISVKI